MKKILIIQHAWEDSEGYIGELLAQRNIAYDIIDITSEPLPDIKHYASVIALGGDQHLYEEARYPYLTQEKYTLQQIIKEDIPFLGICLGGQILAQTIGGTVKKHTFSEIGFYDVHLTKQAKNDPLYKGLPNFQKVFHWHNDVFHLPEECVLLATSQGVPNQAFRFGRCAYGIQYHIELTSKMLHTWLHHPKFQERTKNIFQKEMLEKLANEAKMYFDMYHEHSRIMLSNFLTISELRWSLTNDAIPNSV